MVKANLVEIAYRSSKKLFDNKDNVVYVFNTTHCNFLTCFLEVGSGSDST